MAEAPPFHLYAQQFSANIQGEIGTPMLADRPPNRDPELCCREHDGLFGDRSLGVGAHFHDERMFAWASDGKVAICG
ncbi:MAG TPA: hypothetical protein VJ741_06115 [Solirubrobacteraceae bacterium]|nr:hypothetical protein [Solirubrobacteraceae bacterium]